MTSRAEALRRKKARNSFDIASTPKRGKDKCFVERTRQQNDPEPAKAALQARARKMGVARDKAGDMSAQMLGEDAGRAIHLLCNPDVAKRLWGHYVAITSAEARYHRSIGMSVHPKCAKIEMMQDRFETRSDDVVDIRSEDERDRQAQSTWMRWQGIIGCLVAHDQHAIQQVVRGRVQLVDQGEVKAAGISFVGAMRRVDALCG